MPGEKKLIGVYGQMVEGGEDHHVVTEFKAAKVKKATVKGYVLKSSEDRDDVFAVKGTEQDQVEVEIFKFGPRGQASLKDIASEDGLQLVDVIATGVNADGSTFSDNISIIVDAGSKSSKKLDEVMKKLAELDDKFDEVKALMEEVSELGDELAAEQDGD